MGGLLQYEHMTPVETTIRNGTVTLPPPLQKAWRGARVVIHSNQYAIVIEKKYWRPFSHSNEKHAADAKQNLAETVHEAKRSLALPARPPVSHAERVRIWTAAQRAWRRRGNVEKTLRQLRAEWERPLPKLTIK